MFLYCNLCCGQLLSEVAVGFEGGGYVVGGLIICHHFGFGMKNCCISLTGFCVLGVSVGNVLCYLVVSWSTIVLPARILST